MKTTRLRKFLWIAPVAMIMAWQLPSNVRAQAAKSAAAGGQYNVSKEIMDHKDALNWKPAANGIPADVCTMLQVCGSTPKVIALPRTTEGGQPVLRGVFLTQDDKHAEVLVLERDTAVDRYYFLLTAQGTLAKAAYAQVGSTSWVPVGMALAGPAFDKDKVVWHDWVSKLGTGPAAADKKPDS